MTAKKPPKRPVNKPEPLAAWWEIAAGTAILMAVLAVGLRVSFVSGQKNGRQDESVRVAKIINTAVEECRRHPLQFRYDNEEATHLANIYCGHWSSDDNAPPIVEASL